MTRYTPPRGSTSDGRPLKYYRLTGVYNDRTTPDGKPVDYQHDFAAGSDAEAADLARQYTTKESGESVLKDIPKPRLVERFMVESTREVAFPG